MAPKVPIAKATLRLHFLCAFFGLGSFVWGYNIGIMATIYVNPGFKAALHKPKASQTGLITAIYYLGTWISYIFLSHPASDRLGRRYSALTGILVVCVGAAFQAGARNMAMMIIGRIICGLGMALVSTAVPLYQSEVAPAKQRGKYVVMNHIGLVAGLASAFWVGYAVSFWDSPHGKRVGWRMSITLQYIPAFLFVVGLPFCPETPRWLVEKDRPDEARKSLLYLREGICTSSELDAELQAIQDNVTTHKISGAKWQDLFTQRDLFDRLWRAALLQFMAQMCGATAMKYYLPTLFNKLGLNHRLSLLIGGVESTLKIGCTIIEMFVIDRFGRRATIIAGCTVMTFAMLINGALPQAYPNNLNKASDYACIVFIFFFTFGYSIGFGPAAWVYGSEIFPTAYRARGLNFAASGGAIGSIIVAQVWPVGIQNIGSKVYFYFMAINLVCIPIVYFFYPETKGRSLENMDVLFNKSHGQKRLGSPDDEYQTPEGVTVNPKVV
ncbi:general substrate transporter [Tothia fuscella]|uniref:General substrate transporter n=1 Tax=Tothia fuscella TaxID=1048955 RepID=A0A9P4TZV9_9PEZI|nr:general substrate transporter [Tothia fuscella]